MRPTEQQHWIIIAATGDGATNLVIEAGAGTGKTSTLKMLAAAKTRERGLYVAYNKAIADDAKGSFPENVECRTAHSLAFRTFGRQFSHRLNGPRINAKQAAKILGITRYEVIDGRHLSPKHIARITMDTVARFCHSAAPDLNYGHVPDVPGIGTHQGKAEVASLILPLAHRAWHDDLTDRDGQLRFTHDMYLKLWQLSSPRLGYDFILFDEAQDADPVIASVVDYQNSSQLIMVGDRCQAIYGWRGAKDAMATFDGEHHFLTQSFRFGPAIADAANRWLDVIDKHHMPTDLRLTGTDMINSRVDDLDEPRAILCRSNAQCITELMRANEMGQSAALVGGSRAIRSLAEAAESLMAGIGTDHPELFTFQSWNEVREYVDEEESASDLKVLVRIVDSYGPQAIVRLADRLCDDEDSADVVVSTAHKAKGREWATVRIADDFRQPDDGEVPTREESMLAYVSVTRAQQVLDNHGLEWVNNL